MQVLRVLFLMVVFVANISYAEEWDLFIIAGQSNAQGFKGNAAYYPEDPEGLDQHIRFYWVTPKYSSSNGQWTNMKAQGGRYKKGHFGLEVTFARSLKKAGYNPAIFKYSLGSTSIANNWKAPGSGKMYDDMVKEFDKALALLKKNGDKVNICGFVWIQGESDAQSLAMANAYKGRLKILIDDLRKNVTKQPELPVILGVDEHHKWVRRHPQVLRAQQTLAKEDKNIIFTTMKGLKKADTTHLTPKGLEEHGKRIYAAYKKLTMGQQKKSHGKK